MTDLRSPEPISNLLKDLLVEWGIERKVDYGTMINKWPEIVGNLVSEKAVIQIIEKGKIFLKVDLSVWRQELYFQKNDLIEKINHYFSKEIIKEILFV